jgi:pimeloyl-ACP methyl ester carboxylesterase
LWFLPALAAVAAGCAVFPLHKLSSSRSDGESDSATHLTQAEVEQSSDSTPSAKLRIDARDFGMPCPWGRNESWVTPERLDRGLTIILPGIEGESFFNRSVARGLVDAGHESAIVIHDWTTGNVTLFPYHLMALQRNHRQARQIADRIVAYQDQHPDRPVRLIGHSGGGAMVVLALEVLPSDRQVTQSILLGAALSPDHDLSTALARTERGLWSVSSKGDVLYLMAGTMALGTIDRMHSASAGAVGFRVPETITPTQRRLYDEKLHQQPYDWQFAKSLNFGGHFGSVNRRFVSDWIAPLLML